MKTVKTYSPQTKILSLVLSFLIIFYLIPASVFAEILDEDAAVLDNSVSENEEKNTYTPEIYEVTELREENVKHFRLADGSYVAAQYNYPVHYIDENGQFTDINNRLEEGSGGEYSNSNTRVTFVKKITGSGKILTFAEDDVEISMSVLKANKGIYGSVTNCEDSEEYTELQKKMNLENLSSKILYEEVFDGVDIEYIVQSLDVKENIIVNQKSDEYSYSFEMRLKNLTPTLSEDGSIILADNEGSTKYIIPAPVVYDAAYTYAEEGIASYSLSGNNNKYILTVTVDSEWMNAESTLLPVTVDPTIVATSHGVINQQLPSLMCVNMKAPLKMNLSGLPTLPSESVITSATLSLAYKGSGGFFVPRLVLSDTITGNVCDIDQRSGHNMYVWNVTTLIRQWYDNSWTSRNLTVSGYDAMDTLGLGVPIWLMPASSDFLTINSPTIELNYAIANGIEDYYSYSSHSLINAGSGSVNLANGNLTFISDLTSTTDYIMPITVSAVYNSNMSGKDYNINNCYSAYTSSFMPYGFKLNISETIVNNEDTDEDVVKTKGYILSDGDGTEHIFYEYSLGYFDDSALGRTLYVGTDRITINYKDHSSKTFTKMSTVPSGTSGGWVLSEITDPVGNSVIIELDANNNYRPKKVSLLPKGQTSAIDMLEFNYSYGKLSSIYNLGNHDKVSFNYSNTYNGTISSQGGNYLRRIDYGVCIDNVDTIKTSSTYNYHFSNNIETIEDSLSGQSLEYSWSSGKLSTVTHYSSNSEGQTVEYKYGNGYTDVTTSGNDDDISTEEDNIKTRYIFDNLARAVSVYSFAGDGSQIYGASNGEYETQENAKNNLKEIANFGGSTPNYILNGGFELGTEYWHKSNLNALKTDSNSSTGSYSLKVYPATANTGILSQNVYLDSGNYNLSLKYSMDDTADADIYLRITGSNGTNIAEKQLPIDKAKTETGYAFASMSFEIGAINSVRVEIVIESSRNIEILIDDVMLEKSIGVSEYSMVQAGNFESSCLNSAFVAEDATINLWKDESGNNITFANTSDPFSRVAMVSNSSIINTVFDSDTHLDSDFVYEISGFAYAWSLTGTGEFCLAVNVYYYQGASVDDVCITHYFDFAKVTDEWVYVSGILNGIPDENDLTEETRDASFTQISKIEIICEYSNQENGAFAYFDNITLTDFSNGSMTQYAYDENGNLCMEKGLYDTVYYEYDANNNLRSVYRDSQDVELIEYTYNNVNLVIREKYQTVDANDILKEATTEYCYNNYGQPVSIKVTGGENVMYNYYIYDVTSNSKFFGALTESTDTAGITTRYFYESTDGRLSATITEGDGVSYSYDTMGRLTDAFPAAVSGDSYSSISNAENVKYGYDANGNLSTITTDSTTYTFSYDTFGNTEEVSIGDTPLATYEYNDYNGKLVKITYGNDFSVEYIYNSLELLEEVCYTYSDRTSETVVEYTYTRDGQLHSVRDRVNDTYTVYEYDSGGKLIGSYEYSESDYVTYLASSYEYDGTEGALSNAKYKWNYTIGETEYNVLSDCYYYYNNDDTVSAFTLSLGAVSLDASYTYDELKRIGRVAYVLDTNFTISEEYTYAENDGYTTGLVEQYTHTVGNTSTTYNYTYDSKGNITKIVIGDKEIRYEYDDLGQLIREENGQSNQAVVYTYDNAGNVIQKTMNMLMTGYSEVTYYEYECSQWGDLLTSYRGRTIEYDDIGNPTTYYNGISYEFEWEGRRLVEAIRGSTDMYFTYNDEGIRTGKTVNNARTEYILNGSQILAEITDTYIIVYIYDAYGSPIGMQYKSLSSANSTWEIYWYEKNLQGDVIAVCDSTGTQKVKYIYGSAWGDHSTAYPNNGYESAARYNPFRYRGYYYDSDLMLYYLQSRYYDPNTCRFINADIPETLTTDFEDFAQYNLFVYCFNNPVNMSDETGTWPSWATKLAIGVGAIIIGAAVVAATAATGGAAAAFVGAAVAGLKAAAVSGAIGAAVGAGTSAVSHRVSTGSWSGAGKAAVDGAVDGFANGFMTGGIMAGGSQILSSGFKVAANAGVPTGRNGGLTIGNKVRVLSPNHPQAYEAGGTLLKIGSKYKNIRFDVGSNSMFHMNIQFAKAANYHLPIGILGSGLWGGIIRD